jgi:hypothetical protein
VNVAYKYNRAIDALYLLIAINVTSMVLCFPCYGFWRFCYVKPVKGLKRRAKMNREVAGRLLEEDIEIGDSREALRRV